jgi:hypothetical protein
LSKATSFVKQEILAELKKGNMSVLKGLPPEMTLNYGLAMNEEVKSPEPTPFDDEAMGKFMMKRAEPIATVTGVTVFRSKNSEEE